MKIEIQVKGKEVILADYVVYKKNDELFIFAIRNIDSVLMKKIKKEIDSKNSKIFFEDNNMILEIKNQYIFFDLSQFNFFSKTNENYLIFAFLDKEDKIIAGESKIFSTHGNTI